MRIASHEWFLKGSDVFSSRASYRGRVACGGSSCYSARGSDCSHGRVHGSNALRSASPAPLGWVGISLGSLELLLPRPLHRHRHLSRPLWPVPWSDWPDHHTRRRRRARTGVDDDPCRRDTRRSVEDSSTAPNGVAHTRPLPGTTQLICILRCRRRRRAPWSLAYTCLLYTSRCV